MTAARIEKKLYRKLRNTALTHTLFEPNDKIMVGVSGGKDSYTLAWLMHKLLPRLPFPVEMVAVHLDQRQPGYDGAPLEKWLSDSGIPFAILSEDTYSVVMDHVEEGGTYCSLCSRLRRGILYTAAEEMGCNKLALGHHRDDSLETFMMNLFFTGKLQAMPAKYTTDDKRFQVIRPLIECAESLIEEYATEMAFPILPCNLCGSQDGLKRDEMTSLLSTLETKYPDIRSVMARALTSVRPTHLLDLDVMEAWEARPSHIPPKQKPTQKPTVKHHEATPVRKRLNVLPR